MTEEEFLATAQIFIDPVIRSTRRPGPWESFRGALSRRSRKTAGQCPLPLAPGCVTMAFPPDSGELVRPVFDRGDNTGYERGRVKGCPVTEPEDRWADPDDWIPGEHEVALSLEGRDGTNVSTRDVVEMLGELWAMSPAQFTRMRLALAHMAMDTTDPSLLN